MAVNVNVKCQQISFKIFFCACDKCLRNVTKIISYPVQCVVYLVIGGPSEKLRVFNPHRPK